MTQSTLVDSPGSPPIRSPRRPTTRPQLPHADYRRAFEILETCADARSLPDFKEQLVEALQRHLGMRHISVFAGATFHHVFGDTHPLTAGDTAKMLPEYRDRWSRYDVFGTPCATRQLVTSGVASLAELSTTGALPVSATAYVRHFLVDTWGMHSATALRLELGRGHSALVGLFDPAAGHIGPRELATLRLLSRQLCALSRNLPVTRPPGAALASLSERQREVAALVAEGLSNAAIADTLSLAEDSVKKYVSRLLSATGCQSRMELALLVRAGS